MISPMRKHDSHGIHHICKISQVIGDKCDFGSTVLDVMCRITASSTGFWRNNKKFETLVQHIPCSCLALLRIFKGREVLPAGVGH